MTIEFVCWKCAAALTDLPRTLGRHDTCPACRAELYVCRMCEFHDPGVSNGCREPIADWVNDKERANFCGYFKIRTNAHRPRDEAAEAAARARLEALFGEDGETEGDTAAGAGARSEADLAREQLERLFGSQDPDIP